MIADKPDKRIIYDFGANNGDDIPYYLMKSDLVVAVDANPALCAEMAVRFAGEVRSGRLVIENCVLTDADAEGEVDFYNHLHCNRLSQFQRPDPGHLGEFEKIRLPSRNAASLVRAHGTPHYIKIDVEGFDAPLLRVLLENDIRPPYISAESHTIEVFCLLTSMGGYNAFKLVEGNRVGQNFGKASIMTTSGARKYRFPEHSAGPFGADIKGNWADADAFFRVLAVHGLGWKDIHATSAVEATPSTGQWLVASLLRRLFERVEDRVRRRLNKWRTRYWE